MVSTQVDRINGLTGAVAIKAPVDCATTANVTLSGEQTIDGITTSGSRVLVKNQSNNTENGIYTTSSGSWTRTSDFDGNRDAKVGTLVFVIGGTVNENTLWVAQGTNPLIPSQSEITFANFNTLVQGDYLSVMISALATNDYVRYNGTNWINAPLFSAANTWTGNQTVSGNLALGALLSSATKSELTLATIGGDAGSIQPNGFVHTVDTEGNAASDNLSFIKGGVDGQLLIISTADSGRDVIMDTTGNIYLGGLTTYTLANTSMTATLVYRAAISKWVLLASDYVPYVDSAISNSQFSTKVYQTTGASIANGSWTTVLFDTEDYDDGSWHSAVTNTERITVDFTGRVNVSAIYNSNSTGNGDRGIRIRVDGVVVATHIIDTGATPEAAQINLSVDISATSGQYIDMQVYQSTGGAVTSGTGIAGTSLSVRRIK